MPKSVHRRAPGGLRTVVGPRAQSVVRALTFEDSVEALSKYLALLAWTSPGLQAFRQRVLGGRSLSQTEARAFLRSPALRFLQERQLQEAGIPLLGSLSRIRALRPSRSDPNLWTATIEFKRTKEKSPLIGRDIVPTATGKIGSRLPELSFPGTSQSADHVTFFPNAVLGDLRQVVDGLTTRYPWDEAQAVWLVLTGKISLVDMITTRLQHHASLEHSHNELVICVDPRVPAERVKRTYVALQRKYFGRHRQPSPKNIAVFQFVVDRMRPGKPPDWNRLVGEWNALNGSVMQYATAWRFHRDFERAKKLIAFSKVPNPKRKDSGGDRQ